VRLTPAPGDVVPGPRIAAPLEDVRCGRCHRLLLRASGAPLRPGARLEIKCPRCDHVTIQTAEVRSAVA